MLADTRQLAREHLLETIAILLLGLGGLILWFPFWPIGAIVALFSRLWDVKDKSLAIAGPLLVVLAGSVLGALIMVAAAPWSWSTSTRSGWTSTFWSAWAACSPPPTWPGG